MLRDVQLRLTPGYHQLDTGFWLRLPSVPLTATVMKYPSPLGILPPSQPQEVGLIVPILQVEKLRLREVQELI